MADKLTLDYVEVYYVIVIYSDSYSLEVLAAQVAACGRLTCSIDPLTKIQYSVDAFYQQY
jgi:hypothetical protein